MSVNHASAVEAPPPAIPKFPIGQLLMAVGFFLFGVFGYFGAGMINVPRTAQGIGPREVPYAVSVFLMITSAAVIVMVVLKGLWPGRFGAEAVAEEGEDIDDTAKLDLRTVGLLVATLLAVGLAIPWVGWPLACTVLFALSVKILGGAWKPALIGGAAIAVVTQLVFGYFLGVSLPAFPNWWPW